MLRNTSLSTLRTLKWFSNHTAHRGSGAGGAGSRRPPGRAARRAGPPRERRAFSDCKLSQAPALRDSPQRVSGRTWAVMPIATRYKMQTKTPSSNAARVHVKFKLSAGDNQTRTIDRSGAHRRDLGRAAHPRGGGQGARRGRAARRGRRAGQGVAADQRPPARAHHRARGAEDHPAAVLGANLIAFSSYLERPSYRSLRRFNRPPYIGGGAESIRLNRVFCCLSD